MRKKILTAFYGENNTNNSSNNSNNNNNSNNIYSTLPYEIKEESELIKFLFRTAFIVLGNYFGWTEIFFSFY